MLRERERERERVPSLVLEVGAGKERKETLNYEEEDEESETLNRMNICFWVGQTKLLGQLRKHCSRSKVSFHMIKKAQEDRTTKVAECKDPIT